jgi:hypothetical protein
MKSASGENNEMDDANDLLHPQRAIVELAANFCDAAILETCGTSHRMLCGPLRDAAEVSQPGIPTVMMLVQSLHGIIYHKIEDTREDHLELCFKTFDRLPRKTMAWSQRASLT